MNVTPTTTCFDDTIEYLSFIAKKTPRAVHRYTLAHGIVHDSTGERVAHAWLECGGDVLNPVLLDGERAFMHYPAAKFYKEVSPAKVIKYSAIETWDNNERSGHYGPWDEEIRAECADVKGKQHAG